MQQTTQGTLGGCEVGTRSSGRKVLDKARTGCFLNVETVLTRVEKKKGEKKKKKKEKETLGYFLSLYFLTTTVCVEVCG